MVLVLIILTAVVFLMAIIAGYICDEHPDWLDDGDWSGKGGKNV